MSGMSGSQVPVPPPPERMAAVLLTIAAQARRTNLVRAAEIRAALEAATSQGLDRNGWVVAERIAHQLAGSAGTFGYAAASDLARTLERRLGQLTQAGVPRPDPAHLGEALGLLDRLTEQLAGEPELD